MMVRVIWMLHNMTHDHLNLEAKRSTAVKLLEYQDNKPRRSMQKHMQILLENSLQRDDRD